MGSICQERDTKKVAKISQIKMVTVFYTCTYTDTLSDFDSAAAKVFFALVFSLKRNKESRYFRSVTIGYIS